MSCCEETRRDAAVLMALPPGDPQREAALAHARGCPDCDRELRKASQLVESVDAHLALPPLGEAALARAEQRALAALDFLEAPSRWSERIVLGASGLAVFGVLVAIAKNRAMDGPSVAAAVAVAVLAALFAGQMRSPGAGLVVVASCAASAAFAALASSATGLVPLVGVKCVAIELFAAAWPLGAAALAKDLVRRPGSPWATAALAASGALAGQAALHLTCPVRFAEPHLAVFHAGGVLLAALLGAAAFHLRSLRVR